MPRKLCCGMITVLLIFLIIAGAGCHVPDSTGLSGTLRDNGISGNTSFTVTTLRVNLLLSGSYDIKEGDLKVEVEAPDGTIVFSTIYTAPASGNIDREISPVLGDWTLYVSGSPGTGSYDIQVSY